MAAKKRFNCEDHGGGGGGGRRRRRRRRRKRTLMNRRAVANVAVWWPSRHTLAGGNS
jgi:hypothetical protein